MCRSIKVLRRPGQATTDEELRAAALQFVRKISGFHKPSKVNQEAFERAIQEITVSSGRLLTAIGSLRPQVVAMSERPVADGTNTASLAEPAKR
jgi:hypothetical protein